MKISSFCKAAEDVAKINFETIICGSDQIWNLKIIDGLDNVYQGDDEGVDGRISYAAQVQAKALMGPMMQKVAQLIEKWITSHIFNKDFYAVNNIHSCLRTANLLEKEGIYDRLLNSYSQTRQPIDYERVRNNLK